MISSFTGVNLARWGRRLRYYRPTPFWFLYGALACVPWAGSERSGMAFELARLFLVLTVVTWAIRCLVTRHAPNIPGILGVALSALILQGTVMSFHGGGPAGEAAAELSWLPASRNSVASLAILPDLILLFGVLVCVVDICRHSARRHELWTWIVITGVIWAGYGLAEKIRQPAWTPNGSGRAPFATFSYHANAAAYLNLIWPLATGLLCSRARRSITPGSLTLFTLMAAIPFAAEMVNTSRAGTFLAGVLAILMAVLIVRKARQGLFPHMTSKHWTMGVLLLAVAAGSMIWVGGASRMIYRWQKLPGELVPDHHRWLATQGWFHGAMEAGFFGFGPNSFTTMARTFVGDAGLGWIAEWPYAHMDPLQTVMEWGWVGGVFWGIATLGAMVWSLRKIGGSSKGIRSTDSWIRGTAVIALVGVFMHSLVDYPLQIFPVQLVCICLMGILWSRHRWPETSGKVEDPVE